jgi:Spy/CpxP family protein refolding chaperone
MRYSHGLARVGVVIAASLVGPIGPGVAAVVSPPSVPPAHREATSPAPATVTADNPFAGLVLSPTQEAALRTLTSQTRSAQRAILSRQRPGTAPGAADRAELTRLAVAHNAAVMAVLTPEQQRRVAANVAALVARQTQAIAAAIEARRVEDGAARRRP